MCPAGIHLASKRNGRWLVSFRFHPRQTYKWHRDLVQPCCILRKLNMNSYCKIILFQCWYRVSILLLGISRQHLAYISAYLCNYIWNVFVKNIKNKHCSFYMHWLGFGWDQVLKLWVRVLDGEVCKKNCSRQGESGVRRRRRRMCRTGQFKGKVKDCERDAVMMKGAGGACSAWDNREGLMGKQVWKNPLSLLISSHISSALFVLKLKIYILSFPSH